MGCKKCGKETDTVCYLGEYGQTFFNTKDKKEYCEPCFDIKYPTLQEEVGEEMQQMSPDIET